MHSIYYTIPYHTILYHTIYIERACTCAQFNYPRQPKEVAWPRNFIHLKLRGEVPPSECKWKTTTHAQAEFSVWVFRNSPAIFRLFPRFNM